MNKKTLLLSLIISLFSFIVVNGQTNIKVSGTASKGGKVVRVSANIEYKLMETYPSCVVTIYNAGTLTLSTIYSDEIGTAKSNPFTAGTDASYWFYVAPGRYDIKFSGTGIIVPFTISDFFVATGGGGGGSGVTSFNSRTGAVVPIPGDYTFSGLDFTGSNFNSITTRSASDLNAGTIPDARFPAILPALSGINLTNLNASNLASGTVADARLSTNVPLLDKVNIFTNNNYFTSPVTGIGTVTPRRKLDILDPSSAQLRLTAIDNSEYSDFYVDPGGTLNILPTGNITFDATGNQINPLNNFDQNLGQVNKKYLSIWAAELNVETLVAQNTIATIGGRIIVAPTNQLIADLAPATTTISVKYNNFANGDRIYMETAGQVEFLAVTSGASVIPGGYSYTVTRNLDGTGANQWYAGDAMVNTGVSGDGFIDLYSINGVNTPTHLGPTIVGNVRNSTTYNDWTENWAIGNLNGIYGYGVDTYGAAFGKYAANVAHVTIDSTNGYRAFTGLSTVRMQLANDGSGFLASNNISWNSAGTITIGGWTINANSILSSGFNIESSATPANNKIYVGSGIFNNNSTPIYLDGSGRMSLKDKFAWDGTTLTIAGNIDLSALTSKLTLSGANSAIAAGTTPPTSASVGTGIWLDRTGLYGLLSDVVQVKLDATTGKIVAGAGSAIIDIDGLTLASGSGAASQLKWKNAGVTRGDIFQATDILTVESTGNVSASSVGLDLRSFNSSNNALPVISINAYGTTGGNRSEILMFSSSVALTGVTIGGFTTPAAMLDVRGDTKTNSVQWNTGTRPTCDSSNRGKVWYVAGGAGVADTFEVCKKDAGDAYAWATLY